MRHPLSFVFSVLLALPLVCQVPSPAKWTMGLVTDVKPHPEQGTPDNTNPRYDVSIKVGHTVYVVLYAPRGGSKAIEYRVGVDKPVLVENTTVTYNDWSGNPTKLPILRRMPFVASKPPTK